MLIMVLRLPEWPPSVGGRDRQQQLRFAASVCVRKIAFFHQFHFVSNCSIYGTLLKCDWTEAPVDEPRLSRICWSHFLPKR